MENIGNYYYKIPTIVGDLYFYREYKDNGSEYFPKIGCFKEFFTGLTIGDTISHGALDLDKKEDNLKFELIKDELSKQSPKLNKELKHNKKIKYNYIRFASSIRIATSDFPIIQYMEQLPYDRADFIIELIPAKADLLDYLSDDIYKINASEFATGIKQTIAKYGSIEKARLAILEKIESQSLISKERDEHIKIKKNTYKE